MDTHRGEMLDHLFRHQAGRITAHLARILGPARLDLAEESVQEAMLRALQTWPERGIPENAAAWLFRVARNAAMDAIRHDRMTAEKSGAIAAELLRAEPSPGDPDFEEQLRDDELRMIFMCCHPDLPRDSSIALSLKSVGGFSVREIARAFLAEDEAIAQRLVRAKRQIRDGRLTLEMPSEADLERRLDAVLEIVYLVFNEGYAVHEGETLIRHDLCGEALRLGRMLAASSLAAPRVHALLALMAFQAARLAARVDSSGDLVLLNDQDRSLWDQSLIALGFHHFDRCMDGDRISEYHVQAAIAATHARASGAESVDWSAILQLYDQLWEMTGSPVVALNRAVAISKVRGPREGFAATEPLINNPMMRDYHLLLSVRGHLLLEIGEPAQAADCYRAALQCRCSEPERRFLRKKLARCEESMPRPRP